LASLHFVLPFCQNQQFATHTVFIRIDVSQPQDVEAAFRRIRELYGRLDCACNNAGIDGDWADTLTCSQQNFDRVYQVNVKGIWLCMRKQIALMLPRKRGSIVNTASVAGHAGFIGYPAYTASKHAVMGLTKVAALEYAQRGIRVNAVCPGIIDTPLFQRYSKKASEVDYAPMEPVGRLGRSSEVAEAMLWLCSDESSFHRFRSGCRWWVSCALRTTGPAYRTKHSFSVSSVPASRAKELTIETKIEGAFIRFNPLDGDQIKKVRSR
jgi:NAD(P)-dependent dehydrogenase (short-subunit alcohol dehydrogenase family)